MSISHVVLYSGGIGSWAAAKRVALNEGVENLHLLFTDTLMEDADNYRFLIETAAEIFGVSGDGVDRLKGFCDGIPPIWEPERRNLYLLSLAPAARNIIPGLAWIADGRDPWSVFKKHRMIGNSRIDMCSKELKREVAARYINENFPAESSVIYLGMDWTESHRYDRAKPRWLPWEARAPLCDPPYRMKEDHIEACRQSGIEPPRAYKDGFSHANCANFCIKAGMAHFKRLLEVDPETYAYHEGRETEFREWLGKDIAILRSRAGKKVTPLPLKVLREQVEGGEKIDEFAWGGCGCFSGDDDTPFIEQPLPHAA